LFSVNLEEHSHNLFKAKYTKLSVAYQAGYGLLDAKNKG